MIIRPYLNYDYQDKLKPSKELMDDWNKKGISEEEYIRRYFMEHENIDEILNDLIELEKTSGNEVILLCHCGKDKFCHTRIILKDNFCNYKNELYNRTN